MAVLTARNMVEAYEGQKDIHPFFGNSANTESRRPSTITSNAQLLQTSPLSQLSNASCNSVSPTIQPETLVRESKPVPSRSEENIQSRLGEHSTNNYEEMQKDMNYSRRKRRKITPDITKSKEALDDDYRPQSSTARLPTKALPPFNLTPGQNIVSPKDGDQSALLQLVKSNVSNKDETAHQPEELAKSRQPVPEKRKKILKWNPKTGTIGSPPAKKPLKLDDEIPQKSQAKGRKKAKSLIVKVKYGQDKNTRNLVSKKIDAISKASKPIQAAPQKPPKPSPASLQVKKEQQDKKSTHPFFLGKATPKPFVPPEKVEDITATLKDTPMSNVTPTPRIPSKPSAPHAIFHGFGNTSKLKKFPGAVEPIWPPNGMTHIRGPTEFSIPIRLSHPLKLNSSHGKKSKYVASEASQREDIIKATTSKLDIPNVKDELEHVDNDEFEAPDKCLRLPKKHLESGQKLQKRIRSQISSRLIPDDIMDDSSDDDLHGDGRIQPKAHPAISKAFKMIPKSLSAFDKSECETQSWIHKYAPTTAAEVLQSGREAFILKEWLQTLTVISVESGAGDARASKQSTKGEKNAKRKRKAKKLDGFVISSNEEDDDMDEITEPEDDDSPWYSQGLVKKTVIRAGDAMAKGSKDPKKLTNAVVISGPSGCGKTAAVYAVAKELGFEVFEINPSCKRSGKDILERVGDMTKNHLVQHAKQDSSQDEDLQRASAVLEADIKSGRQGTMNSFFKANPSEGKEAVKSNKPKAVNITSKNQSSEVSKKPKQQKQSLILLEEVDVLYEEDKQFWATVITLILESKRPIVMTCNDESVVPLQALALHAIIRMTPPPIDLAVDYMLLVAANEGHALKREAVASLYKVQRRDLRSSMTELEFWCQMTVGDRRGGFDWFYPRYPRGCDKDSRGNTIRVISEDTYRSGMGWLGRDSINDDSDAKDIEEEILHEAWNGWQLDAGDWHETLNMESWASKLDIESIEDRMVSLEAYDDFADSMSAADVYACGAFRAGNQALLDPTGPKVTPKSREDNLIGHEFLQADILERHDTLARDISIYTKTLCRSYTQNRVPLSLKSLKSQMGPLNDSRMTSYIANARCMQHISTTRYDYCIAFDPIATPDKPTLQISASLEPSCFDRTMAIIATDIAPYIRSIVAYDEQLRQERAKLSNLLSAGGRAAKRMRTTRSAFSALEGGTRSSTRKERWFGDRLNPILVARTGSESWREAADVQLAEQKARRDAKKRASAMESEGDDADNE